MNTWGQRFITAPLAGRTAGDYFRILAANYSTVVRVNGKHIKTLDEGKYVLIFLACCASMCREIDSREFTMYDAPTRRRAGKTKKYVMRDKRDE